MAPSSDSFTLFVNVDDGVNPTVSLTYDTILYNEIPEPVFTVIREDNYSQNTVTLDGSQTSILKEIIWQWSSTQA